MLFIFIYCISAYLVSGENTTLSETGPDYCNQELYCPAPKGPHIACNNKGGFGSECTDDAELIELDEFHIEKITDLHNFYRNQLATGDINGFLGATRMAKMTWSKDLAYLAELHVKRCLFEHDSCRNTDQFKYAGQNIYMFEGYPGPADVEELMDIIYSGIAEWESESLNANMSLMNSFYKTVEPTGHFTVMVLEQNTHLGCAGIMFTDKSHDPPLTKIIFTCNYATTNIMDHRTYESGKPGSKCVTGTDMYYYSLCSDDEYFDPNQHYKITY